MWCQSPPPNKLDPGRSWCLNNPKNHNQSCTLEDPLVTVTPGIPPPVVLPCIPSVNDQYPCNDCNEMVAPDSPISVSNDGHVIQYLLPPVVHHVSPFLLKPCPPSSKNLSKLPGPLQETSPEIFQYLSAPQNSIYESRGQAKVPRDDRT